MATTIHEVAPWLLSAQSNYQTDSINVVYNRAQVLDELRHFLLIADTGTFSAAAPLAHLSQPALTASIQRLEASLGGRLFHRGAGGTRLTASGEALLPRARAALVAFEEGRRAVSEIEGLSAGEVRIGAGATVCTYYLPPLLNAFRKQHPRIVLKLRELTSDASLDSLAASELDLAMVMPTGREARAGLVVDRWMHDELIWVGPKGATIGAPVVTFPHGASTRELLDRHFPGSPIVMELSGISAVIAFVKAGTGNALVSRAAVSAELARGGLVEIPTRVTPIRRHIDLLARDLDRLSPAALALRRHLLKKGLPVPGVTGT
jgi:DNA-binding transcriptional LysR family regulator